MPAVAVGVAIGYGASAVVSVGWAIAIGIGGAIVADSLTPEIPDLGASTSHQELNTAPASNRTRIYGQTVTSGPIVKYNKETAGDDEYHHFFTPLANHECDEVLPYQLDGKNITSLTGSGYRMIVRLGTQVTALAEAVSEMSNVDSTFVGFGVTDVYHKYIIDSDIFPNGVQDVKFLVKGAKVYDPRKDTTVGGDGTHRANEPGTWEWSDNPALINLDWKRFFGDIDIPIERFDLDNIAQEANVCDELVTFTNTDDELVTQKRFTCNGVLDLSVDVKKNQRDLLSSCAGRWIKAGGMYYLATGIYRGPAVLIITDDDIKGPVKRSASASLQNRCNVITSTFVSKNDFYQTTDSTPVISEFYRFGTSGSNGRDRGRYLNEDRVYNFTDTDVMVQRLNRLYMEYVAAGDTLEMEVGVVGYQCAPATTVNVMLTDENITNKEYEVLSSRFNRDTKKWSLLLKETAPAIFDDTIIPAETDLTPNTEIDNTFVAPIENLQYVDTPQDSFRQGYLAWSHPVANRVSRYIALITDDPEDSVTLSKQSTIPELNITNLDAGAYIAYISAENTFSKRSEAVAYSFNVGLPNTPTGQVGINVLPGRVIITGPDIPNQSATYQWKHAFVDDFEGAFDGGRNTGLTVTGTPHNGTLYVWYRLVDGDLMDPNWVSFAVPNLIGISVDEIDPETIGQVVLPGNPLNLSDTLNEFSRLLIDFEYWSNDLNTVQIRSVKDIATLDVKRVEMLADIVAQAELVAEVDSKVTSVTARVDDNESNVSQAIAAIASETQARALLEQTLTVNFAENLSEYVRQVDLFTTEGAAEASVVAQLRTEFDDSSTVYSNQIQTLSDENQARITELTQLQTATDQANANFAAQFEVLVDENQARIDDLTQFEITFNQANATYTAAILGLTQENQARIDDFTQFETDFNDANTLFTNQLINLSDENQSRIDDLTQFQTTFDNSNTAFTNQITALSDANQARIDEFTVLQTSYDTFSTQVGTQLTSLSNANGSRVSEIQALQTQMGGTSVEAQILSNNEAQIGYDDNGTWIAAAPFASSLNAIKVINADNDEVSVFQYLEALGTATGELEGRLQFGVDQDGRITQQIIDGATSTITFAAEATQFTNTDGDLLLGFDSSGQFVFNGTGTFTGNVRAKRIEVVGDAIMEITDPAGFGPDNLFYWFGFRILDSNLKVDDVSLTKQNALDWKDLEGNSPVNQGGDISAPGKSTVKTLNPSVTVGPFASNGDPKTIVVSFTFNAADAQSGTCSGGPYTQPSITVSLEKKIGSGSWTVMNTYNWSGMTTLEQEESVCLSFEDIAKSITVSDNDTTVDDISYRVVTSNHVRYHVQSNVNSQILSLIVTESQV